MNLTPDEKARADAVRRALGGAPESNPESTFNEPSRGALYYLAFTAIAAAVGVAIFLFSQAGSRNAPDSGGLAYSEAAPQPKRVDPPAKPVPAPVPVAAAPVVIHHAAPVTQPPPPVARPPRVASHGFRPAQAPAEPVSLPVVQAASTLPQHRNAAMARLFKEGGSPGRVEAPEPVPGWPGRYRTVGEATFWKMSGNTPKPKAFEILTEEKDGVIEAIDFTVRW